MKSSRLSVSSCLKNANFSFRRLSLRAIGHVLGGASVVFLMQAGFAPSAAKASARSQIETTVVAGKLSLLQRSSGGSAVTSIVRITGRLISTNSSKDHLQLESELLSPGLMAMGSEFEEFDFESECDDGIFEIFEEVLQPSQCKVGEPCAAGISTSFRVHVVSCQNLAL